jgi:2-polyprenyl-3-methyl-5-hydroxy-6-metoxy-1,4-benzoquinol methylase
VPEDLTGEKQGHAERFVPDVHVGRLLEAEHLSRYHWAATLAKGRRVLDAGCGTAYGSRLLVDRGATSVLGVDVAAGVLEAAASEMPSAVTLRAGDLREIPAADGTFDLVVCFEVIEHVPDPEAILDELVRVLAPDGLLLISSPNRGIFPAGNPHHQHEFVSSELRAALERRLSQVRLVRQHDYLLSAVLSEESFLAADGALLEDLIVGKISRDEPDRELYTVAMASRTELPAAPEFALLTSSLEFREWIDVFQAQEGEIRHLRDAADLAAAATRERDELAGHLMTAESEAARLPQLQLRIEELLAELDSLRDAHADALRTAGELESLLNESRAHHVALMNSPSWRITAPLRRAKRLLSR